MAYCPLRMSFLAIGRWNDEARRQIGRALDGVGLGPDETPHRIIAERCSSDTPWEAHSAQFSPAVAGARGWLGFGGCATCSRQTRRAAGSRRRVGSARTQD